MTVFHIHFPHCDLIHNGDVAPQKRRKIGPSIPATCYETSGLKSMTEDLTAQMSLLEFPLVHPNKHRHSNSNQANSFPLLSDSLSIDYLTILHYIFRDTDVACKRVT
jgi:hypothetical protein